MTSGGVAWASFWPVSCCRTCRTTRSRRWAARCDGRVSRMTSSRSAAGATSSRPWRVRAPRRRSGDTIFGVSVQNTEAALASITLARVLRRRGFRGRIVCGGHFASLNAADILNEVSEVDVVVRLAGEEALLGLARGRARRSSSRRCRERSFAATTAPFGSARPPGRSRRFRAPCTATSCRSISASAPSIWWAAAAARRTAATVASRRPRASPPPRQGAAVMDRRMTRRPPAWCDGRATGWPVKSPPSITRGRHGFSR